MTAVTSLGCDKLLRFQHYASVIRHSNIPQTNRISPPTQVGFKKTQLKLAEQTQVTLHCYVLRSLRSSATSLCGASRTATSALEVQISMWGALHPRASGGQALPPFWPRP